MLNALSIMPLVLVIGTSEGKGNRDYISIASIGISDKPIPTVIISKKPKFLGEALLEYNIIVKHNNYIAAERYSLDICATKGGISAKVALIHVQSGEKIVSCQVNETDLCLYFGKVDNISREFNYLQSVMVRYGCKVASRSDDLPK